MINAVTALDHERAIVGVKDLDFEFITFSVTGTRLRYGNGAGAAAFLWSRSSKALQASQ
jgi:hypothetical protein